MLEKILDIFKIFLEKYFIPSILAVVLTFGTYFFTPADNSVLVKLTVTGFSVCCFLVWFLVLFFIISLFKKIKGNIGDKKAKTANRKKEAEADEKVLKEALEQMWTIIDGMSFSDYQLLLNFLNSENKPYLQAEISCGGLLNSDWVYKTQKEPEKKVPIQVERTQKGSSIGMPMFETISATYQYVLKDEIYNLLKYSMEKYGKISHFEH